MTTQVRDTLTTFVADIQMLRARCFTDDELAPAIARRLALLLDDPDWLSWEHRQPADDHYRQHLLYVAPDGGFSVVSLVWRPGQATCIHDHVAWCIVGVYQGQEEETRYRLYDDQGTQFLVEEARQVVCPGEVAWLVPPNEDIHRVTCISTDLAISIHVYGSDIGVRGTSINHRFDDLPIRLHAGKATPVDWRTTRTLIA